MKCEVAVSWLTLLMAGCGPSSVAHHQECPLITGTFNAESTLESSQGTCGRAKPLSFDSYTFDAQGAFVSHLDPIVSCRTDQEDCSITVHCSTDVIKAKADFAGTLSRDGTRLSGTATFSGQYQGCTKVVYQVAGTLVAPRRIEHATRTAPPEPAPACSARTPKGCSTTLDLP